MAERTVKTGKGESIQVPDVGASIWYTDKDGVVAPALVTGVDDSAVDGALLHLIVFHPMRGAELLRGVQAPKQGSDKEQWSRTRPQAKKDEEPELPAPVGGELLTEGESEGEEEDDKEKQGKRQASGGSAAKRK